MEMENSVALISLALTGFLAEPKVQLWFVTELLAYGVLSAGLLLYANRETPPMKRFYASLAAKFGVVVFSIALRAHFADNLLMQALSIVILLVGLVALEIHTPIWRSYKPPDPAESGSTERSEKSLLSLGLALMLTNLALIVGAGRPLFLPQMLSGPTTALLIVIVLLLSIWLLRRLRIREI